MKKNKLYENIIKEIKIIQAKHLKECNCMKAFYRNLSGMPNNTSRYVFDEKVGSYALTKGQRSISLLAIGSGTLLNELTAIANILARGISVNIYLTDFAYVFYGDDNYKDKALKLGEHPEDLPDGWKDFLNLINILVA